MDAYIGLMLPARKTVFVLIFHMCKKRRILIRSSLLNERAQHRKGLGHIAKTKQRFNNLAYADCNKKNTFLPFAKFSQINSCFA